jgi:hypothetical protein
MLNITKNETIFPDYIKLNISDDLVDKINSIVEQYKTNVSDAVVYSLVEQKTLKSVQRNSLKTSFRNLDLESYIKNGIFPLINSIIKKEYPNCSYSLSIGTQSFDYIKYDTGGYFDSHRDWVRIGNSQQVQYTLLLGLTSNNNHTYKFGGNTIIWIPVNYLNQYDYGILTQSEYATDEFKATCKKYSLSTNYDEVKNLLDTNKSGQKCIPAKININNIGSGLLFQSNFLHSGEIYSDYYKPKELLGITVNITGIANDIQIKNDKNEILTNWLNDPEDKFITFDEFESWMCQNDSEFIVKNNLFPFQIIISSGTYNNKKFNDKYLKYLNLFDDFEQIKQNNLEVNKDVSVLEKISKTLNEIYNKTKNKLNTRGRESHIESKLIDSNDNFDTIKYFENINWNPSKLIINDYDIIKYNLENYLKNLDLNQNSKISRFEEILNTWEESTCNDDGDEYDETTYLNCQIDIKFCFYKI